jgi:hypothetical protein
VGVQVFGSLFVRFLLLFLTSATISAGLLARVARAELVVFAAVSLAGSGGMGGGGGGEGVSFGVVLHKHCWARTSAINGIVSF